MKLTKPAVASLAIPAGKSELIVFDNALPGFGVRLRAGGKRTWVAQYRVGTKQRRFTLGSVAVVELDEARKRARELMAHVQLGADPQAQRAEARARAAVTLGIVADRYLKHAETRMRPRGFLDVRRYLRDQHWKPLRETALAEIRRADVAAQLARIAEESGTPTANRARAWLSACFAWAMGEGLAEANPVIGTNKPGAEIRRDRVLSMEELVAVWRACRDDAYGRIVRLLILTAQRREEVGAMVEAELDIEKALWTIPADRTKNGREHEVPLAAEAAAILADAPRFLGRDSVFGASGGGFGGWSKAKVSLEKRVAKTGIQMKPWRLHDIRRTAATMMGEDLGVQPHIVEAILNHVSGHKAGVAGTYNRAIYRAEKRRALDLWAAHVSYAQSKVSGNVFSLVPRAS